MLGSGGKRLCFSLVFVAFFAVFWDIYLLRHQWSSMNDAASRKSGVRNRVCMFLYMFGEGAVQQSYVKLFFESCRHSGIDIVVIGSPVPEVELPPNVRHVNMTWEELKEMVVTRVVHGKRLSALEKADHYKAAEFRPLIAFLFPELVEGYEWWGHMDYDIVLGNVSKFLTPDLLDHYDILCPHPNHRSMGPFMLYRNHKTVNELFKLSPLPLERLFNTSRGLGFEEWSWGLSSSWGLGDTVSVASAEQASMSGIIKANAHRLGLRWKSSSLALPFARDALVPPHCRRRGDGNHGNNTCEYSFEFPTTGRPTDDEDDGTPSQQRKQQQQRLFHDHSRLRKPFVRFILDILFFRSRQHHEMSSNAAGVDLVFFHFVKHKKEVEALLKDKNETLLKQILEKGRMTFVYLDNIQKSVNGKKVYPELLEIRSS